MSVLEKNRYCHTFDDAIFGHSININFLGILNVLGNDNWMFIAQGSGSSNVSFQILFVVSNIHGSPTQDIGRPDKAGVSHIFTPCFSLLEFVKLLPLWLQDIIFITQSRNKISYISVSSRKQVLESWVLESKFSKASSRKQVLESKFSKASSRKRVLKNKFLIVSSQKRIFESKFSKQCSRK
jgi:hypothetical protein